MGVGLVASGQVACLLIGNIRPVTPLLLYLPYHPGRKEHTCLMLENIDFSWNEYDKHPYFVTPPIALNVLLRNTVVEDI